jgi:dienelactone hydrolase
LTTKIVHLVAALARAGFVAIAPDVVAGRLAGDPEEAAAVAAGIDAEDASLILAAAADTLAADPDVRRGRLGAVGLGVGAPLAAFVATVRPEIGFVLLAGPVPALPLEAWGRSEADVVVVAEPGDGDAGDDGGTGADDAALLDRAVAAGQRVERVEVQPGERRADAIVRALVERLRP